jgi:cytidylate kinase
MNDFRGSAVKEWVTKEVDDRIGRMVDSIRRFHYPMESGKARPFVTLSRQYGCDAFDVASGLVARLNERCGRARHWEVYDRSLVELVASDAEISDRIVKSMTSEHRTAFEEFLRDMVLKIPSRDKIFIRTARVIKSLAWHGYAVIIGRGGYRLCSELPHGFHVQIVAPAEWRAARVLVEQEFSDSVAAMKHLRSMDRVREEFFQYHFDRKIGGGEEFDMVINNSRFPPLQIVDLILRGMEKRGLLENL